MAAVRMKLPHDLRRLILNASFSSGNTAVELWSREEKDQRSTSVKASQLSDFTEISHFPS